LANSGRADLQRRHRSQCYRRSNLPPHSILTPFPKRFAPLHAMGCANLAYHLNRICVLWVPAPTTSENTCSTSFDEVSCLRPRRRPRPLPLPVSLTAGAVRDRSLPARFSQGRRSSHGRGMRVGHRCRRQRTHRACRSPNRPRICHSSGGPAPPDSPPSLPTLGPSLAAPRMSGRWLAYSKPASRLLRLSSCQRS
jgi:hypothetical protein